MAQPQNARPNAGPPPPVSRATWLVLVSVGVGTFMSALDASVVNIVLPDMRIALDASVAAIQWVVLIYLLVVSGMLLVFGRLGDMRGYKRIYVSGFLFFVTGSILCGLARDEFVLVGFRGFQAFGAAMLFASSPAILTAAFPPQRRGQVLGLQATLTYLGLTVGPPLGGVLSDAFGWPVIFYINVPIGLIALLLAWRFIPAGGGGNVDERFDVAGAATFLLGLVALLLALNQGHEWGWLSPTVLGLLAFAATLLVTFVLVERRVTDPMLDLTLFRERVFASSTTAAILNYISIYTVVFLMPFYLTQGRGLSAGQAGLLMAVQSLVMAATAPLSGSASDRIGTRAPRIAGMVFLGVGTLWLSLLGSSASFYVVVGALALVGLGTGIFVSPNTSALLGAAPPNRRGIASGILAEARNVGMVLGVGLAGAVFNSVLQGGKPGPDPLTFKALSASFAVAALVAFVGAATAVAAGAPRPTGPA